MTAIARAKGIDLADIEVWFGDEARVGQKNKLTRRWVKRGTRPCAPQDQRTASTYIFGAICPKDGKGAGLVLPWCNIEAMALQLGSHLAESRTGPACRPPARPGWMACLGQAPGAGAAQIAMRFR